MAKAYGVFALTDETYGITSAGAGSRLTGFGITVLQVVSHLWWIGGAALGALIGQVIPSSITGFCGNFVRNVRTTLNTVDVAFYRTIS